MKFLLFVLIFPFVCCAQKESEGFNRAIEKGKLNKIERKVKKEIRKIKHGIPYDNGPGSGMQINHSRNLDSLSVWLKKHSNVEDALWDKCAMKVAIYPGWVVVGVKFKTKNGVKEMCFHIQQGTLGNVQIFKWRPHLFKIRNILKYKKMYECPGFIEQQKQLCSGLN